MDARKFVRVVVPPEAPNSVDLNDRIERVSYRLTADDDPNPTPVDRADAFPAPVSVTVALDVDRLRMADLSTVYLHSPDGDLLRQVPPAETATVPPEPVVLELGGPMKIYLAVDGGMRIASDDRTVVTFAGDGEVLLGARSFHESPADTITTTAEPRDVMTAVSAFGGALKTTSPEASFPTLRGHPPRLEVGDELHVPSSLRSDHSDVVLRVPETLSWVFRVAPLAYYTAGRVEPREGGRPVLETASQRLSLREHGTAGAGYTPGDVLKRTLFWDTVVRTVGLYEFDTWEREAALDAVDGDVDLSALYDLPVAERIDAYLELPALTRLHPKWGRVANLYGEADELPLIPYLVNSLALIREPEPAEVAEPDEAVTEFFRGHREEGVAASAESSTPAVRGTPQPECRCDPDTVDDAIATYTADETNVSANWLCEEAFEQATRDEVHNQPLASHVVCNEPEMDGEIEEVSAIYAERTGISSPVQIHERVTVDELASLLRSEAEYLHYVGHVTDEGIPCEDGVLDVRDLDEVGTRAFFLNACASVRQGRALVTSGSIGGIVTTSDVPNTAATKLGANVARLLNAGFSLESAVSVIGETSIIGTQYRVLGAGEHALTYAEAGTPMVLDLQGYDPSSGAVEFRIKLYSGTKSGMGSLFVPHLPDVSHLVCYRDVVLEASLEQFEQFAVQQDNPLLVDDEVYWSTDVDVAELARTLS